MKWSAQRYGDLEKRFEALVPKRGSGLSLSKESDLRSAATDLVDYVESVDFGDRELVASENRHRGPQ